MDKVQNCDSYINIPSSQTYRQTVGIVRSRTQATEFFLLLLLLLLTCWARSKDVMRFLWGTDKRIELSWVLNKRQGDDIQNCDSYINIPSSQTYR
jgi:hypothetical protein